MPESLSMVGLRIRVRRTVYTSLESSGGVITGVSILVRLLLNKTSFLYQLMVGAGMPVARQLNSMSWPSLVESVESTAGATITGTTGVIKNKNIKS